LLAIVNGIVLQPSIHVMEKGRRERVLPLWKETAAALRDWLKVRGDPKSTALCLETKTFEQFVLIRLRTARYCLNPQRWSRSAAGNRLLPRNERLVWRGGKQIRLDHRVNDASGITRELARRHPAQFLDGWRTQRNSLLLSVAFCIDQKELWPELEWLKQATALSDGALKQAFRKGRSREDADRYGTGGLTGDGYVFWVATKGRNVSIHPSESGDLVHQTVVARLVVRGLALQFR